MVGFDRSLVETEKLPRVFFETIFLLSFLSGFWLTFPPKRIFKSPPPPVHGEYNDPAKTWRSGVRTIGFAFLLVNIMTEKVAQNPLHFVSQHSNPKYCYPHHICTEQRSCEHISACDNHNNQITISLFGPVGVSIHRQISCR